MNEYYSQILIVLGGVITTVTAWNLGGKQNAKSSETDSIAKGTDSLIGSLEKMVEIMNINLEKEAERTQIEREHRDQCEQSLSEHKAMIDQLRKEINALKKKVK